MSPLPPLLLRGDCMTELRRIPDESIDAVVCDPPYGLEFMGKAWDKYTPLDFELWCAKWAAECLRILKPGGHLLAFGGTRTWHRLAAGIEDAGFEIRDSIAWLYGSGFPKSMDVSKAIDKRRDWKALANLQHTVKAAREALGISQSEAARRMGLIAENEKLGGGGFMWFETGMRVPSRDEYPRLKAALALGDEADAAFEAAEREITGYHRDTAPGQNMQALDGRAAKMVNPERRDRPATDAEREWEGWGTALKPAFEPIVVARKPLGERTVAANVLRYGVGALNIDATRIGTDGGTSGGRGGGMHQYDGFSTLAELRAAAERGEKCPRGQDARATLARVERNAADANVVETGRWPANVALDESQAAALDEQTGTLKGAVSNGRRAGNGAMFDPGEQQQQPGYGDTGGASRFFYVAKAPKSERPVYWRPSCNCETIKPCAEPSPQRATDESRSTDDKSWSTSTSGKKRKGGKSHRATTSTTETATSSTTSGGTFNSSRNSSTSESIQAAKSGAANGGSPAESAASSSPSPSSTGTSLPKGGPSTVAADPAILSEWSETSVCANCGAPARRESHATVKPLALMRWLIRLVTPPGGVVVDPFAGSGTTLEAAYLEGFESIGVEMTPEYWPLVAARIERVTK